MGKEEGRRKKKKERRGKQEGGKNKGKIAISVSVTSVF